MGGQDPGPKPTTQIQNLQNYIFGFDTTNLLRNRCHKIEYDWFMD